MESNSFTAEEWVLEIPEPLRKQADYLCFKKGQLIYQEGSTPLGAYFIESGSVKITKLGSSGKEQILRIITNGELLCLSDLFSQSRYANSAKTIEDTSLLFVPKQAFWRVLREHDQIFQYLLQQLAQNIKMGQEKVVDMAYKPVRGRLADAILDLDHNFNGRKNESHSFCLTRTDLAGYIGTVKETVNRLMSEFKEEQIISTVGSSIEILDMDRLNKVSKQYN